MLQLDLKELKRLSYLWGGFGLFVGDRVRIKLAVSHKTLPGRIQWVNTKTRQISVMNEFGGGLIESAELEGSQISLDPNCSARDRINSTLLPPPVLKQIFESMSIKGKCWFLYERNYREAGEAINFKIAAKLGLQIDEVEQHLRYYAALGVL